MPEEQEESKEEQQDKPGGAPESNGAPTAQDLAAIKAELEEEKKAIAEAQAIIQEKDATIAELQNHLSEAKTGLETTTAELAQVKDAYTGAVGKYLEVTRTANPAIPGDVIAGATIEEIDAALAKATSISGAVKAGLEAQAKETRVPAGAPARGEISLEGLSPREKIVAGIQQKGGQ
jgi:chromosome segregation ATPase